MFRNAASIELAATIAVAFVGLASWSTPASRCNAQEVAPAHSTGGTASDPALREAAWQEVLASGPVHEAYAQPTAMTEQSPMIVPTQAPPPVLESPPALKPQGENMAWIPGYWAWDDGRKDFIWVSGIWRDPPPDHVWFAGYWAPVKGGYRWAPGIWAPANAEQVEYVPEPPKPLEIAPTAAAPTPNDFWIPGNYEYVDARFAWRPGRWAAAQHGWIWARAHYVWTPSGHLFLKGHWDHELSHRGTLFAPVAFHREHWVGRQIEYRPMVMINPEFLTADFFVRPSYYHYYFGDYYGPEWASWGLYPWFDEGVVYDDIFIYYRWRHGTRDSEWARRLKERYTDMCRHSEKRPPRLYSNSTGADGSGESRVAVSIENYAQRHGPTNFQAVTAEERKEYSEQAVMAKEVALQRASAETQPSAGQRLPDKGVNTQAGRTHSPGEITVVRPSGPVAGRVFDYTSRPGSEGTQHAGVSAAPSKSGNPSKLAFRPWTSTAPAAGGTAKTGTLAPDSDHRGTTTARTPPTVPKK